MELIDKILEYEEVYFMGSYVTFSMHGFNRKHKANKDGNHFEYTMSENKPYLYQNHPFWNQYILMTM